MADFQIVARYVLGNEGGFSNRSADRGGPTKYGITQVTAERFFNKKFSIDDMKLMRVDQALQVLESEYWKPLRLATLNSNAIASAIMDTDVNRGQLTAIHLTQETIKSFGLEIPKTQVWTNILEILNQIDTDEFITQFSEISKAHYEAIAQTDATQKANLDGWINRANKLMTLVSVA